jgi:hypothetical protein
VSEESAGTPRTFEIARGAGGEEAAAASARAWRPTAMLEEEEPQLVVKEDESREKWSEKEVEEWPLTERSLSAREPELEG